MTTDFAKSQTSIKRSTQCSCSADPPLTASPVITNVLVEIVDEEGRSFVGPIILDHSPGASILFRRATPFYQRVDEMRFWVTAHLPTGDVHGRAVGLWQSSPKPTWTVPEEIS